MSSGDALVDNVKIIDPFVGATRMGHAPATGVLPSEAGTAPGKRERLYVGRYERETGRVATCDVRRGGNAHICPHARLCSPHEIALIKFNSRVMACLLMVVLNSPGVQCLAYLSPEKTLDLLYSCSIKYRIS